jgi:arylsulfatase A-like enzyme
MTPKHLVFHIFVCCALTASLCLGGHASAESLPNVVLIIADDLGYADLGFLPQAPADVKKYGTPAIDRLARTGVYFENAYASSPICSPSRAGLITGRFQQRWGNYWYGQGGLPQDERTIPEALKEQRYVCAKYGKTHLNGGPKEFPTLHGFDEFLGFMHHTWDYIRLSARDREVYQKRTGFKNFGCQVVGPLLRAVRRGASQTDAKEVSYEEGFTTEIFTHEACRFIEQHENSSQPFYLHVAYNAVDQPTYVTEKTWAEKTGARHVPWDRNAKAWAYPYWEPNGEAHQVFHRRWGHMGKVDPEGRRCYLSHLLALDHGVGRILDTLEKTGLRRNTLVVFISDNGGTINSYSSNTPLNGYKYMFGEGGIRIPMIVSMPSVLPQGVVNRHAMVSTMDIFPTILDLQGTECPANLDGKSLLPVLRGERTVHHEWLAWAQSREKWVLRKGKWKLSHNVSWTHSDFILNEKGDCVPAAAPYVYPDGVLLFDLENDISETTNLADQHPDIVRELLELHKKWDDQMGNPAKPKVIRRKN